MWNFCRILIISCLKCMVISNTVNSNFHCISNSKCYFEFCCNSNHLFEVSCNFKKVYISIFSIYCVAAYWGPNYWIVALSERSCFCASIHGNKRVKIPCFYNNRMNLLIKISINEPDYNAPSYHNKQLLAFVQLFLGSSYWIIFYHVQRQTDLHFTRSRWEQECIPVWCVPSAAVVRGGCLPGGVCPGGMRLSRGVSARGVCLGVVCSGGCLPDSPP